MDDSLHTFIKLVCWVVNFWVQRFYQRFYLVFRIILCETFDFNLLWNISSVCLAKWLSVRLRTKWLCVLILLQSQYFHPIFKQIFAQGDLTKALDISHLTQGTLDGRETHGRKTKFKSICTVLRLARSRPPEVFFWICKYAVNL